MKKYIYTALFSSLLFSCQNQNEQSQTLEQLDKSSAREVILSSKEIGDTILHITQQKIWEKDQLIAEKFDTLKTLKSKAVSDSTATPIFVTIQ